MGEVRAMLRIRGRMGLLVTALLGIVVIFGAVLIVTYPELVFSASLSGLQIWWKFVFPALLPFFVLSELMLGLGLVHALGVMMDPVMRVLFRLPGASGWAVAMGITVGFPAGAKAAVDLHKRGVVTVEEGSRLLALSHLCSPIFLTSVVAVGFWGHPELGIPLMIVHLISALTTGILISHLVFRKPSQSSATDRQNQTPANLKNILHVMNEAQRNDGRPLGRLLGDAVSVSFQSLLMVGGFMILFSVLLELLSIIGVTSVFTWIVQSLFIPWGMPASLAEGFIAALLEIHLGLFTIAQSGGMNIWIAAMLSAMIGWGGLSLHAQVKSFLGGTDLRYAPFLWARFIHAAISVITTILLWEPLKQWFGAIVPAVALHQTGERMSAKPLTFAPDWPQWMISVQTLALFLCVMLGVSLLLRWFLFMPKNR